MRSTFRIVAIVAAAWTATPLLACDLCPRQTPPLSWEIDKAEMVVFGSIVNARLNADGVSGTSDLRIETRIKDGDAIKGKDTITLPRYVPPDPKNKTKFLILLDVRKGQLDAYRGIAVLTDNIVKYLQTAPALNPMGTPEERSKRLLYYFQHLDDADPEVATDAYKEFALSGNAEVGLAAGKLSADKLRRWMLDKNTPAFRLSLYGFLLGACGTEKDAELLKHMLQNPDQRSAGALDGLLAGYISLRPEEGWKLTTEILADTKREFTQRHAVVRMLRFYYGYQPEATRPHALKGMAILLKQADIMDIAVEQLRNWKLWDLTDEVLALYGTKDADVPITKRAIIRYALTCPRPEAQRFVAAQRQKDLELVKDVEESLQFEAPPKP